MESQWIVEEMTTLKGLYDEYRTNEKALSRCIGCMIRMLNSLAQMEYSQFHFYERQILVDALRIFTKHFIEQVKDAKWEADTRKKKELIDDIENAVDSMIGVYKNMIDSTANSDRQMLSSISIDTSIYELSPKICAFYSLILNKLVKMFQEDDGEEYAFVLHPTLKSNTETRVMFGKREKSGKVVIIYLSESIIERFDTVVVFLLHEAFHVLTKNDRKRKMRFGFFFQLVLAEIKQVLFSGVFADKEYESVRMEDELLRYFFADCKREIRDWDSKDKYDRDFYSSKVAQWGNSYFNGCLIAINQSLETLVREMILKESADLDDFESYEQLYESEKQIVQQIRKNLLIAMSERRIFDLINRILFLYREIYADIACILTLNLGPDDYQTAFEKSKQFFSDENYFDSVRVVRNYIVALSVASYMPEKEKELWDSFAKKLLSSFPERAAGGLNTENFSTIPQEYVILNITPQMKNKLLKYAQECASAFSARLNSIEEMDSFRKCMSRIRDNGVENKQELLKNILMGDFDKIFSD